MVRKTTLDLNEELLGQAKSVLGTVGIKDTIDRALYAVVVADARHRTIARLQTFDGDAEKLREDAWVS